MLRIFLLEVLEEKLLVVEMLLLLCWEVEFLIFFIRENLELSIGKVEDVEGW